MTILRNLVLFASAVLAMSRTAQASGDQFEGRLKAHPLAITSDDSIVPPTVPGFELRVLDAKKRVTVDLDAERSMEINLPIYIYFPKKDSAGPQLSSEIKELRVITKDLARVSTRIQDPELQTVFLRIAKLIQDYSDPIEDRLVPVAPPTAPEVNTKSGRVVYEKVVWSPESETGILFDPNRPAGAPDITVARSTSTPRNPTGAKSSPRTDDEPVVVIPVAPKSKR